MAKIVIIESFVLRCDGKANQHVPVARARIAEAGLLRQFWEHCMHVKSNMEFEQGNFSQSSRTRTIRMSGPRRLPIKPTTVLGDQVEASFMPSPLVSSSSSSRGWRVGPSRNTIGHQHGLHVSLSRIPEQTTQVHGAPDAVAGSNALSGRARDHTDAKTTSRGGGALLGMRE
eukprot:CAMPEP_0177692650 /NCGR_PEP_ID=MMETSP0484_2-20121128/1964_1 /TAXON_ID=354590 /ORGANISM="Rhodomonas lens, Strain RHODO" /LENGTH=171 /DNA_ID=CAMNT_0019203377 /DNA_START=295 /DNA_END=808 /DNA_ORIENTATION=-